MRARNAHSLGMLRCGARADFADLWQFCDGFGGEIRRIFVDSAKLQNNSRTQLFLWHIPRYD